jgi:hypothetical protein
MLAAKADDIDKMVKRLNAMSRGLRHAAVCPAPSHAACPSFQRLLEAAASGALESRQKKKGPAEAGPEACATAAWIRSRRACLR